MADCQYSVPDKDVSGDNLYGPRSCDQPFIDWAWSSYHFDYDWWQDGWGYNDCCNTDKPLARAFNGLWALNYSALDYADESYSRTMLHWAGRYVREQMSGYVLRATCGDKIAATFGAGCTQYRRDVHWDCSHYRQEGYEDCSWDCCDWWPCSWGCEALSWVCRGWIWLSSFVCDAWGWIASWVCTIGNEIATKKRIELYVNFFYGSQKDVPGRASTFVHECRHIAGKSHRGTFPPGSGYGSGDGADESWDYDGAWRWQVVWLWWFYVDGQRTTRALRERAKDNANYIIQNAFSANPGFTIP